MFLRSLTVRGFKSFAERTTLEFTPGISVIVGPNGSGKSNLADAIAWVLGEQGPRALRGGQMTDVVFAGSPGRAALGMAEVRMVIDNAAGLIPVPASEIEISRAVFRSGESEYRLGGRPCRLLDIQELLSDTGMGRALHTIVSQGHLDDVLSARPEDRRQYIEEAAGIAKHRRRKERAERKLAGLEQDLNRLQDVVSELRRQLKPLKQQAELAAKHDELATEAAALARKLAAVRLRDERAERDAGLPGWEEAERRERAARDRLAELDAAIAELDGERALSSSTLRRAEDLHARALEAKGDAEERLRRAVRAEAGARERVATAAGRSGRLFALEEELDRTDHALTEVAAALAVRDAELAGAQTAYERAVRTRRDAEDERRRAGEQAVARRLELEALERALAASESERASVTASLADVRTRIDRLTARATELEATVERLDAEETPVADEHRELGRERAALSERIAELQTVEKGLLAQQSVVDARLAELSESPGVAFRRRRGDRPLGMLEELLGVPPHLRAAARGALGTFADAVVYATSEAALADAGAESSAGVTLAVALENAPRPAAIYGERRLLDALRPDARVVGLAGRLLGEVYLVTNLAEAAAKHRVHPYAEFVTHDGAVVGPSFVRVAFGHDVRVERNRRESAALERELASVRRELRETRARLTDVGERHGALGAELEAVDGRITTAAEELADLESELASLRREEHLVQEREAALSAASRVTRDRVAALPALAADPPPMPEIPEPPLALRVEVEALRRDRARLDAGVQRARREIHALAAEDPDILRAALEAAQIERASAEESLRDAAGNLAGAQAARDSWTRIDRGLEQRQAETNRAWRAQAGTVERLRAEHEELYRARLDVERRLSEAELVLREGHGAEPEDALGELTDEDSLEDLRRRSDLVGRRLGLLGRVNLLAVGELEPRQQRHDFMVRELEDVRAARRDLREVVTEVERRMRELFDQAFADVSTQFSLLFAELFPGGEGTLTLTDAADPLSSGIEVEARPGGKRVRRLSLLSGGERSLAALAFLFAIFRARPSPFYLMDEVEAALDDVNLHRFLEVVRTFASTSQLLIVTHQKRTMEMADVLYGVSMGKDGASAVVAQRLSEVHAASA